VIKNLKKSCSIVANDISRAIAALHLSALLTDKILQFLPQCPGQQHSFLILMTFSGEGGVSEWPGL